MGGSTGSLVLSFPRPSTRPQRRRTRAPVDPFIGMAQIVVAIGVMAAILLQSRGSGLSAAFGGDSSVYRSRRGVEKRLYQFTVALAVLFAVVSMVGFLVSDSPGVL